MNPPAGEPPWCIHLLIRQVPFREPHRFTSFDLSRPHSPVSPGFASFWAENLLDEKIGDSALRPGGGWGGNYSQCYDRAGLESHPGANISCLAAAAASLSDPSVR